MEEGQTDTLTLRLEIDLASGRILRVLASPTLPAHLQAVLSSLLGVVLSTQKPELPSILHHASVAPYERALQKALKNALQQYLRQRQTTR